MDIYELSSALGKDQEGRIIHPGITFPGSVRIKKSYVKRPEGTPEWEYYLTSQAGEIIGTKPRNVYTTLLRKGITHETYGNKTYWKKSEVDKLKKELPRRVDSIPKGYITIDEASRRSGVSVSVIRRKIEKYPIRSKRIMATWLSNVTIYRVIFEQDFKKYLPQIQSRIATTLLASSLN